MSQLHELQFSDLYLGKNYAKVKNLQGAASSLVNLPDQYAQQLQELRQTCRLTYASNKDPEFSLDIHGVMFRVVMVREISGDELFVLRRFSTYLRSPNEIGYPPALLRELLSPKIKSGLVLLVGETGVGKTTTVASLMVERLKRYGGVAVTVEDPPEIALSGTHGESGYCVQVRASRKTGGFGEALTRALRMAPDIIMVGEVREYVGADQAADAALNGHLVFSTAHASDVISGIERLVSLVASRRNGREGACQAIAKGLQFVIHQKLVKTGDGSKKIRLEALNFNDPDTSASIRAKIANDNISGLIHEITLQNTRLELKPN